MSGSYNPYELQELFREVGFSSAVVPWYHYHPAMPMIEGKMFEVRKAAMRLETERNWRGMFLCPAGVIERGSLGDTADAQLNSVPPSLDARRNSGLSAAARAAPNLVRFACL